MSLTPTVTATLAAIPAATPTDRLLVYAMFAMVVLTALVLRVLFRRRVRAVREGALSAAYFRAFRGESEPESTVLAARHFTNLFEAPTLFYAACLAAVATHTSSPASALLAWLYVLARVLHARVHLGRNRLGTRIRIYFAGWVVLAGLWLAVVWGVARA